MFGYLYGSGYGVGNVATANSALTEAEQARTEIQALRDSLHRALIANEALWNLVSERLQISEADLTSAIDAVEKKHENDRGAVTCPSCHRPTSRNFPKCYYCGANLPHEIFA